MAVRAFSPLWLVLNFLLLPLFLYSQGPQGSALTAHAALTRDALGALKGHNYVRNKLHLPLLTWNTTLARDAQVWANHLAKIDQLVHSTSDQRPGEGENLYFYYKYATSVIISRSDLTIFSSSAVRAPYPMTQGTFAFVSEITKYHNETIPQGDFEGYGHYSKRTYSIFCEQLANIILSPGGVEKY